MPNCLRETEEDRRKQTRLFQVFSDKMNLNFKQFKSTSKKYRIDGYLYDEKDKSIKAWIECKWYTNKAHCMLNVPKYIELISLSKSTGIKSYLLFREGNKWGIILLHDGKNITCGYTVKQTGGTPDGRIINDDDVEPLICLNKNNIEWGN